MSSLLPSSLPPLTPQSTPLPHHDNNKSPPPTHTNPPQDPAYAPLTNPPTHRAPPPHPPPLGVLREEGRKEQRKTYDLVEADLQVGDDDHLE